MRIEKLIERVEGEATLLLRADSRGLVESARILFPRFRGIEKILERKEAMDALAITPRVCGICGHAHLIATVRALEACYEAAGAPLAVSPKAETIREITLMLEMAQNHFKWFYLTLLPAIPGFDFRRGAAVLAAHRAAAVCARAIALFAGQWPHNSYALPGGVACDPTHVEVMQALGAVEEAMAIFRDTMGGIGVEEVACLEEPEPLLASGGELGRLYRYFKRREWLKIGGSHDRFLVLSDHPLGPSGKSIGTRLAAIDPRWVEEAPFPQEPDGREHFARAVRYRGRHYETGPLARAMVARHPLARKLHRRYKDSMMVRIAVRVAETARLLWGVRERLGRLRLDEPSYIEPPLSFEALGSVEGRGAVEAARGSLLHTLRLKNGKIARYCIVTPTQWNLVGDGGGEPGVAQRALQGLPVELAETVFKSFDVCSVCTTQ